MNDNTLANILNKEEFVSELEGQNIVAEKIEEEWQKVEKIFSFIYLQKVFESLPEDEKNKIAQGLNENLKESDMVTFTKRMSVLLKDNPEIVDRKVVVKEAAEEAMKQYLVSLKG